MIDFAHSLRFNEGMTRGESLQHTELSAGNSPTDSPSNWFGRTLLQKIALAQRLETVLSLPSEQGLKGARSRRRQASIAAAAIILLCTVNPYLFHREVHASDRRQPEIVAVKVLAPQPPPMALERPKPKAEPQLSKAPSISAALRDVQSHWERGEYSRAMTLVEQALAENPENQEALAWKKRISAAQRAEAALK
jgi:hypothetical protein